MRELDHIKKKFWLDFFISKFVQIIKIRTIKDDEFKNLAYFFVSFHNIL